MLNRKHRTATAPTALTTLVLTATLVAASGCGEGDQITRYTVPKKSTASASEDVSGSGAESAAANQSDMSRDRMLAAIVPRGEKLWFFKLTGPNQAIEDQMEEFLGLVQSLHFEDGKPKWELPEGWQQRKESGMRFATIELTAAGARRELSVMSLPAPSDDFDESVLLNVNRWRRQMKLGPITSDQLYSDAKRSEETQKTTLDDGTPVVLVNLVGRAGDGGMSQPPFASQGDADVSLPSFADADAAPDTTADQEQSSGLSYDVPDGWSPGRSGGMRKAAFEVHADGQSVEITVIPLAAAGSQLLPNVNRWRGQVGLDDMSQQQLDETVEAIEIGGVDGHLVELVGSEETILAAVAIRGNVGWFFKLRGDPQLAAREKDNFKAFVTSVEFE